MQAAEDGKSALQKEKSVACFLQHGIFILAGSEACHAPENTRKVVRVVKGKGIGNLCEV